MSKSDLQRFMAKVTVTDGCWLWRGATTGAREGETGYGAFKLHGHVELAHRVSYEHFVGPVADGQVLDHSCDNRLCVNPNHVAPATHRENILRGTGATARNAVKTHCPEGHPYDTVRHRRGGAERSCSRCNRKTWRESKRRARAAA